MADLALSTVSTAHLCFGSSSAFPGIGFANSMNSEGCGQVLPTWHPFPSKGDGSKGLTHNPAVLASARGSPPRLRPELAQSGPSRL